MDGHIRIDTRLQTDKLDNDIKEIEKKIDAFRKKEQKQDTEIDGIKVTGVSSLTEEEIKEYNELVDKLNELKKQKYEIAETNNKLQASESQLTTSELMGLDRRLVEVQKLKDEYKQITEELSKKGIDINSDEAKAKLEGIIERFNEFKRNIQEDYQIDIGEITNVKNDSNTINANVENIKLNIESLKDSVSNISKGLGGLVKKALKWGLAIFSVRSAYMFIRQSVSTLARYNEQLKVDLDYIRYAMANAMAPVVEKLVNLAYTLLQYLNKITMSLFGLNIFANSSAKAFASANKSAKELAKTIAPFDEMNIMNSSSGSSGGGSLIKPSVDLSVVDLSLENLLKKIERFVSNIEWKELGRKLGEAFISVDWAGIGSTILSILWESLIGIVELFTGVDWGPVAKSVSTAVKTWINTITKKFAETDWQKLGKDIMKGIVDWVTNYDYVGLAKSIADLFLEAWNKAIPNLAAGMINGLIDWILNKLGIQHDSEKIGNDIAFGVSKGMNSVIESTPFIGTIYKIYEAFKKVFKINSPSKLMEGIGKNIIDGLKNGMSNAFSGVKSVLNIMIEWINKAIAGLNKISINVPSWVPLYGGKKWGFNIKPIPKLATGGIINRPTYAQIGEAGREAVLPLDRNTEWMEELAKKINSNGGVVNVYLDGRLIQRQYNQRQEEFNFATNGGM